MRTAAAIAATVSAPRRPLATVAAGQRRAHPDHPASSRRTPALCVPRAHPSTAGRRRGAFAALRPPARARRPMPGSPDLRPAPMSGGASLLAVLSEHVVDTPPRVIEDLAGLRDLTSGAGASDLHDCRPELKGRVAQVR